MSEAVPIAAMSETAQPKGVGRWHYFLLALIIVLGGALRFAYLDRPALWGDEAATWARTCGTFDQMLEGNRDDGFVPLHYELYWWMGQHWKLTPTLMRLVPALCGALMVPAMYFLARQLLRPNTALLVALFTATSAYFLNYSRDAKMYMETWLAVTLHLGFLLWWLRGGRGVAWWGWVASGVAAVGLHASAWLVIPIGTVFLITSGKPRLWRWLFYPVGIAVIGIGPYVYYTGYNTWKERSGGLAPTVVQEPGGGSGRPQGNWFASGIAWIEGQTRGKTGPELVRNSLTAYLYGYSRAEEEARGGAVPIPPAVLDGAWGALAGIAILFMAGLVHWPSRRDVRPTAGPWQSWQVLLWLGLWVAVPTYGFFYCRSVAAPASPVDWVSGGVAFLSWHLAWIVPVGVGLGFMAARSRAIDLALAWLLGGLLVAMTVVAIVQQRATWYVAVGDWAALPWVAGAFIALGAAVSWASCAGDFRGRVRRLMAGLVVVIGILVVCELSYLIWDHLRQGARAWRSIWMPRYLAVIAPAILLMVAISFARLPGRVVRAIAVCAFVGVNLAQYGARIYFDPEPRIDLMTQDIAAADRDPTLGVFVKDSFPAGSPGTATVNDSVARYYLFQQVGGKLNPIQARNGPTDILLRKPFGRFHSIRWLMAELRRRPGITRLVLWERMSLSREQEISQIQAALGKDWQLSSEWTQHARRHWNWQDLDTLRRLEFGRISKPATAPAPSSDGHLFGDP